MQQAEAAAWNIYAQLSGLSISQVGMQQLMMMMMMMMMMLARSSFCFINVIWSHGSLMVGKTGRPSCNLGHGLRGDVLSPRPWESSSLWVAQKQSGAQVLGVIMNHESSLMSWMLDPSLFSVQKDCFSFG